MRIGETVVGQPAPEKRKGRTRNRRASRYAIEGMEVGAWKPVDSTGEAPSVVAQRVRAAVGRLAKSLGFKMSVYQTEDHAVVIKRVG